MIASFFTQMFHSIILLAKLLTPEINDPFDMIKQ